MCPHEVVLTISNRKILQMIFGLHGDRRYTTAGIAHEFGITSERVRTKLRAGIRYFDWLVKKKASGEHLSEYEFAELLEFGSLVSAIEELRRELRESTREIPLSKLKERVPAQDSDKFRLNRLRVGKSLAHYEYDVALSFARPERPLARYVATVLRHLGFSVFYDDFYPKELWGKELTVEFDAIYRKKSRYCVIFVSPSYADRMWTHHERKSALARALEEKGNEYILPIEVEPAELPGILPVIGHLSLKKYTIEQITEMLKKKLEEESPLKDLD